MTINGLRYPTSLGRAGLRRAIVIGGREYDGSLGSGGLVWGYPDLMTTRPSGRAGQRLSATVRDTYGTTCHLCGRDCADDFTVDHVIPFADGGTNELSNLRPAHGRKTPTCQGNYGRGRKPIKPSRNPSRVW